MAFQLQTTDLYVVEGTSFYLAPALVSLDWAGESDQFVQIDSSAPLFAQVPGGGVTISAFCTQADVPLDISFDDATLAGADIDLTLSFNGDIAHVTLHILDNDDPNRPTDICVEDGGSVAEDADAGMLVATLSTTDPTPNDTFTYQLINNSNFVLGGLKGNQLFVAPNAQLDFEAQSMQVVQVMTTDAAGHQLVKDIPINITDSNPDLDIIGGKAIANVAENADYQVELLLSDTNGNPVSITGVSGDTDFFTLDQNAPSTPGVGPFDFFLTFVPQDFENPRDVDGDNVYDYTITASDGISTTTKTFHFTVTNVSPEALNGTANADILVGGSDIDQICGYGGTDVLNGMEGNDTLTGGIGKDIMTGGVGADTFNFDLKTETCKGANRDVILDFNSAEGDHIDLAGIDAKSKTKTIDDHFKFIGTKAFHHKAGELHYIKKAGYLLAEGDMDGNGKADFQIEVHGVTKLGVHDFIL